jgi:hypothetical protein
MTFRKIIPVYSDSCMKYKYMLWAKIKSFLQLKQMARKPNVLYKGSTNEIPNQVVRFKE